MRFDIMTLFPEMVMNGLETSIIGRAVKNKILEIEAWNIRDYAFNKHSSVDDYPYGGGAGMLMQAEPVYQTYLAIQEKAALPEGKRPRVIYLSPQGKPFNQKMAEDFAKEAEYRERFDLVVSRAVANLSSLSEYCIPYTKVNGIFVSYKSGKIEEELEQAKKAIFLLGGKLDHTVKFQLEGSDIERSLVIIKKHEKTAKKYPRKAAMPSREPLS